MNKKYTVRMGKTTYTDINQAYDLDGVPSHQMARFLLSVEDDNTLSAIKFLSQSIKEMAERTSGLIDDVDIEADDYGFILQRSLSLLISLQSDLASFTAISNRLYTEISARERVYEFMRRSIEHLEEAGKD